MDILISVGRVFSVVVGLFVVFCLLYSLYAIFLSDGHISDKALKALAVMYLSILYIAGYLVITFLVFYFLELISANKFVGVIGALFTFGVLIFNSLAIQGKK